ncbi:MAG: hypothetical protein JNK64_36200 [Myxococcales bacterium]|nr:hypothetical protein [Myxococcales bacterium]
MYRALVIASLGAACGAKAPPGDIANRSAPPTPPAACPADASPFAAPPPGSPDDACIHGASSALLAAAAAAPTCHVFHTTGATSAAEAVTLADGRRVWIGQGGCVHASIEVRGPAARRVAARDRPAVLAAAAELLAALDALAAEPIFDGFARDLTAAAPAAPTGSFPLGAGDWTAEVEVGADGGLTITLDFPL